MAEGEKQAGGEKSGETAVHQWLVDGFNVLHASMLGSDREEWWREERREELMEASRRFDRPGAEIWVVFDGPRPDPEPTPPLAVGEGKCNDWRADEPLGVPVGGSGSETAGSGQPVRVHRVFAPSADDWLVRQVRESGVPARVAVVSADRKLGSRVRHHGGTVVHPRDFLHRCRLPQESESA